MTAAGRFLRIHVFGLDPRRHRHFRAGTLRRGRFAFVHHGRPLPHFGVHLVVLDPDGERQFRGRNLAAAFQHDFGNGHNFFLPTVRIGEKCQLVRAMGLEVTCALAFIDEHARLDLRHVRGELADEQDDDADVGQVNADLRPAPLETAQCARRRD